MSSHKLGARGKSTLPFLACSLQNSTLYSRCVTALLSSAATATGLLILLLIRYQVENAVHIGKPTNSMGLSSRTRLVALSLISFSSKSQGLPSPSEVVRSNANPGITLSSCRSLDAAVILGGH